MAQKMAPGAPNSTTYLHESYFLGALCTGGLFRKQTWPCLQTSPFILEKIVTA